ncbi:hypothetical protein ZYGNAAKF_CDS0176 [Enterococcus phage VRE9_2]
MVYLRGKFTCYSLSLNENFLIKQKKTCKIIENRLYLKSSKGTTY